MSTLAGMNLALSRLDGPKCPVIDIDTFYIDTKNGIKTVSFLLAFYNEKAETEIKQTSKKGRSKKSGA